MTIFMLCFACIAYNALYMHHCVLEQNKRAALGSGVSMLLLAAGSMLFMITK